MTQQFNRDRAEGLAIGLGWFSVGLGLAELSAPRAIARLIGIRPDEDALTVLRTFGAREIASGVAILAEPDRAAWLWSRVTGAAVDFLSLMQADKTHPARTAAAAAAVLGVAALDVVCAQQLSEAAPRRSTGSSPDLEVAEAITINRPIGEVYAFWRRFENFPRFMRHIDSIEASGNRSRWRAVGPAGMRVEWEAELIEDRENERISWRTVENSDVQHYGSVRFAHAPGARGTEIWVHLRYSPPAGKLGRGIAWLFGKDPEAQIREDLRRFKQLLETGEVVLSDGPSLWRPAQPIDRPEKLKTMVGVQS